MGAETQSQVISAARFVIDFPGSVVGRIAFSELSGIQSKVASTEYIYNDDKGATVHTKQYGKTEPPTITLKRGLDKDGNDKLLAWHVLARRGKSEAHADGTLSVYSTDADASSPELVYLIEEAWCSDLSISGMKAGDSSVATIECKITCSSITAG